MTALDIQFISAEDTLPIRQAILWPNHPIEVSKIDGDALATHFGGYIDAHLVGVASLFQDDTGFRLRKFAVDQAYQGQGIGRKMLIHMQEWAWQQNAGQLWFDARQSAQLFYQSLGFEVTSGQFLKRNIPYVKMSRKHPDPS